MNEDIKVTFIIPKLCNDENDCTEDMQLAFTACEQHRGGGLQAQWVHESQWKKFEGLTRKDVFVLTEFDGELYEKLRGTKCLLVGPRCLSCCLTEGSPIPSGSEPVFTVAMRGLVITASGLSKQQKENIKRKVHWMGGIYNMVLTDETTHLVSDTVLSDKYIKAVEQNIPVMSETWIEAVWEASLQLNINGGSPEFDAHRLPPFANLQITTSGISKKEKQVIMKRVNENGGLFSGAFQSETTDVVVLNKEGVGSEKYKAALEYGKACVTMAWVQESAKAGTCLPFHKFRVAGASTSSPLAEHRLPDMSLNFSRITNLRQPSNFVDETRSADVSTISGKLKLSQDSRKSADTSVSKEIQEAFDSLDMSQLKKIGQVFDGFCIWITGLEGVYREKAATIVSRLGGVRYDCPHDRVTHIVAGNKTAAEKASRSLPAVPVLSPLWLAASAKDCNSNTETEFLIDIKPQTPHKSAKKALPEVASPMSKRNLQLLRRGALDLPPPIPLEEPEPDLMIVDHYLSQNVEEPPKEKTPEPTSSNVTSRREQTDITDDLDDPTEEIEQIFRGVKLEVHGLDACAIAELSAEVCGAGGTLVGAGAGGTHALLTLLWDDDVIVHDAEPVTVFWVKDCLSQQELLPIQYYHRPVKIPHLSSPGPLQGCVISLSTYSGIERAFLDELAKLLGATTQLRFCRRNTANALASTHLICPTPSGDKYTGAVKWGLPAVKASWLLECSDKGIRVPEDGHLVGETKAPQPPIPEVPEDQSTNEQTDNPKTPEQISHQPEQTNKENVMLPPDKPSVPRRPSIPSRENTPKAKGISDGDDLSPASRYIAMARQGLLGSDSQETPKRVQDLKDDTKQDGDSVRTPPLDDALSTPNLRCLSPTTRRRLQAVKRGEMPSDPIRTPTDPFEKKIETPDSAFGAVLRPGGGRMSPEARKRLRDLVDHLPNKEASCNKEKTPLSEIRNRFLAQFTSDSTTTPSSDHSSTAPRKLMLQEQTDTPPPKKVKLSENQSVTSNISTPSNLSSAVDLQLQKLSAALNERSSQRKRASRISVPVPQPAPESEPGPESQPNTVGWDDTTPAQTVAPPQVKRFMLSSNVDNREEIIEMIEHLGGEVSEGTELDLEATHLLCAVPGRSEKMLGSVAAGRWVLHPAYIARSRARGMYLQEEEFEWGNPQAACLPQLSGAEKTLANAAYRWRRNRHNHAPGPFAGVVALLHVPSAKRRLLSRLVTAGDGLAPDIEPPYSDESITVCFADVKRYPLSERDIAWLSSRNIPVCPPVLLSSYLTDETTPNPRDHCINLSK